MAHINLLPWREEQRKQKQKEFIFTAGGGVVIAGLIVLMAHLHVNGLIEDQNQRNAFLENEIEILNQRIARIQELESMKQNLLARMNVIQELQSSRPESVHLMDELVTTLPDGVYLNTFTQKSRGLTMVGIAQSNARVSDYMRAIDSSEWLTKPHLNLIKTTESNRRRIANFTLQGKQKALKKFENEGESGGEAL
jgi:type IV pilus assembly protein PilN